VLQSEFGKLYLCEIEAAPQRLRRKRPADLCSSKFVRHAHTHNPPSATRKTIGENIHDRYRGNISGSLVNTKTLLLRTGSIPSLAAHRTAVEKAP